MGTESAATAGPKFSLASIEDLKSVTEMPRRFYASVLGISASCLQDQANYLKKLGECVEPVDALKWQWEFAQQCWLRSINEIPALFDALRANFSSSRVSA